jgi:hypothetical protein
MEPGPCVKRSLPYAVPPFSSVVNMVQNPSRAEARLAAWMRVSLVLYAFGGLFFFLGTDLLFDLVNVGSRLLGLAEIPKSTERFWLTLSLSMMLMLCVCCLMNIRDPSRHRDFAVPVIFSKFLSSFMGLVFFLVHARYGAYLAIGLSDLPLGVVTLHLWRQAKSSS